MLLELRQQERENRANERNKRREEALTIGRQARKLADRGLLAEREKAYSAPEQRDIDRAKKAQEEAEMHYERAKAEYHEQWDKDSREFPDATDKELAHGLRHLKAVEDDWFHQSFALNQIIRILEDIANLS